MRVAIIGYGFVGKAIEFGTKKSVEIIRIDPNLNNNISEFFKAGNIRFGINFRTEKSFCPSL